MLDELDKQFIKQPKSLIRAESIDNFGRMNSQQRYDLKKRVFHNDDITRA